MEGRLGRTFQQKYRRVLTEAKIAQIDGMLKYGFSDEQRFEERERLIHWQKYITMTCTLLSSFTSAAFSMHIARSFLSKQKEINSMSPHEIDNSIRKQAFQKRESLENKLRRNHRSM